MDTTPNLPDDIATLQSLLQRERDERVTAIEALHLDRKRLESEIRRLENDNRLLHKIVFGRSTEKRPVEVDGEGNPQGWIFANEIIAEAVRLADEYGTETKVHIEAPRPKAKKKGRRQSFPKHLPVVQTICELPENDRKCPCGGELTAFSQEIVKELERIETTVVHETIRRKYCCRSCQETIVTAPWRGRVIEKGLLGPGFLAHVITDRFAHHMPYYRLEKKYESEGLSLSRSVLCQSMSRCAELLEPIANELKREVLASPVIHTDDTPVNIANSSDGGPRKGRIWVYLNREGRHWYDCTETRQGSGPAKVLQGFDGAIQADAYGGYDQFYVSGGATEVACWAHVRRKFIDAEATDPDRSAEAVEQIRKLFKIESEADKQNLGPEARQELREKNARPLVEEFREWMTEVSNEVLPKGPLGKAIGYATNQWGALTTYLDDGRRSISNNAAERALRPIAVGRKNWMFFQRSGGGKTAATLLSLLETAKVADVNVRAYFRDVLLRIATCSDVSTLTPHGWKATWEPEVVARQSQILQKLSSSDEK